MTAHTAGDHRGEDAVPHQVHDARHSGVGQQSPPHEQDDAEGRPQRVPRFPGRPGADTEAKRASIGNVGLQSWVEAEPEHFIRIVPISIAGQRLRSA